MRLELSQSQRRRVKGLATSRVAGPHDLRIRLLEKWVHDLNSVALVLQMDPHPIISAVLFPVAGRE
jgi:hypothetical protein